MDRLTHSTARPKHLEQNLNTSDLSTNNNKQSSASQKQTAPPALRNTRANNGIKLYPFIQQSEYKYEDLVYSSERSSDSVVTLSSRPTSIQKKNSSTAFEALPIHSFEQMPEDVIRKILFENVIDLNDIPKTANNLMNFASTNKVNREFIRVLLSEKGLKEVSFEITKSFIPNLLATLAKDNNAQFTQANIDELVHNWPYLTVDSSLKENTIFTNRGLKALKKIVCHPGLKEIRIINNLPEKKSEDIKNFQACIINGLELIYSLLSRKSASSLKVDLIFKNWEPLFLSDFQFKDKALGLIKEIKNRDDSCSSVIFGEMDLSTVSNSSYMDFKYKTEFVKIMCNIALTHSAHTISLAGFYLSHEDLGSILDEMQLCDNSSLQHLDLSTNLLLVHAVENLAEWLKSDKNRIKNLILNRMQYITFHDLNILADALKNNNCLELVVLDDSIHDEFLIRHPIRKDERVKYCIPFKPLLDWI